MEEKAGMGSFSNKHRRIMTLCGAVILFVTFVVRDNLRDKWRDTSNEIILAQNLYGIRADLGYEREVTGWVDSYVRDIRSVVVERRAPVVDEYKLWQDASGLEKTQRGYLDTVGILVEALPANGSDKTTHDDLLRRTDQLEKRLDDVLMEINPEPQSNETPTQIAARQKEGDKHLGQINEDLYNLIVQTDEFTETTIKRANEIRQLEKLKAGWADAASIFLYILGWALALYGNLTGIGASAEIA